MYFVKEKVINDLKKKVSNYKKGDYLSTEKIAKNYLDAITNSRKTVKNLDADGLPGLEDSDERNQWLNTKSVTFSNVYEAIEYLLGLSNVK